MTFRVALGRCDCSQPSNELVAELCKKVRGEIERLRSLTAAQLAELTEETREAWIGGRRGSITVRRAAHGAESLIVVQVFVSTWRWPTYFSLSGIGHLVADGFLIDGEGMMNTANDELLWEFR